MLLASLVSQRGGMTKEACNIFLKTLDQMKYHVKTALGISDEFYTTTETRNVHGPGQGGRGSPSIWVTISCLLMECLRGKSIGLKLTDTDGQEIRKMWSSGFVDDITLWLGNMEPSLEGNESIESILDATESAAQWWEALLHATGGKLELSKCFFYLIFWKFDEEGVPNLESKDNLPRTVKIEDSQNGTIVEIETKECSEAHKTLGVMERPDGKYAAETQRLTMKARDLARRASCASITEEEAHLLYHAMVLPSMTYSAVVGTLTRAEADKINSILTQAFLNAMGYNRSMPREVVYGPKYLGGIGLLDMFVEQGAAKVQYVLSQIRLQTPLGKVLLGQLKWAQITTGTSNPILEFPWERLPHLAGEAWITTLREYLVESSLAIRLTELAKRQGDKALMSCLGTDLESATNEDIRKMNQCRLYLRAETIADLCNAAGTHITKEAWECEAGARIHPTMSWPNQVRPGPKHRKAWKDMLSRLCKDQSRELYQPLGRWIGRPSRKDWEGYIDHEEQKVVIRLENRNLVEAEISGETRNGWTLSITTYRVFEEETENMEPIDLYRSAREGLVALNPGKNACREPERREKPLTWQEYVDGLQEWERVLMGKQPAETLKVERLTQVLTDPEATVLVVSDGGCKDNIGGFGWVMASNDELLWKCAGRVQGTRTRLELLPGRGHRNAILGEIPPGLHKIPSSESGVQDRTVLR
jgi:hypothetical protein